MCRECWNEAEPILQHGNGTGIETGGKTTEQYVAVDVTENCRINVAGYLDDRYMISVNATADQHEGRMTRSQVEELIAGLTQVIRFNDDTKWFWEGVKYAEESASDAAAASAADELVRESEALGLYDDPAGDSNG